MCWVVICISFAVLITAYPVNNLKNVAYSEPNLNLNSSTPKNRQDAIILQPVESPDYDGLFYLEWSTTGIVSMYFLLEHDSLITEYNSSTITIANPGSSSNNYLLSARETGVFYYALYASTNTGWELSNCIKVIVVKKPSLMSFYPYPNTSGEVLLNWTEIPAAEYFSVYRHSSMIFEVNDSISLLSNVSESSYIDSGMGNGDYFYVVTTHIAGFDSQISQCKMITVELSSIVPGFPISIILTISISMIVFTLWRVKKQS